MTYVVPGSDVRIQDGYDTPSRNKTSAALMISGNVSTFSTALSFLGDIVHLLLCVYPSSEL